MSTYPDKKNEAGVGALPESAAMEATKPKLIRSTSAAILAAESLLHGLLTNWLQVMHGIPKLPHPFLCPTASNSAD
jgi:hypothetical protein